MMCHCLAVNSTHTISLRQLFTRLSPARVLSSTTQCLEDKYMHYMHLYWALISQCSTCTTHGRGVTHWTPQHRHLSAVVEWYGAGLAIARLQVRLPPVAAVYQRQLSVPSLRGRLMSTSGRWGVNGHTTRCTSPISVVLRLQLVSGEGLR